MKQIERDKQAGWRLQNSYADLPAIFYTRQLPTQTPQPELVAFNESLAEQLGFDTYSMQQAEQIAVFAGNRVPHGSEPLAEAYAAHQFGHFNILGDGRALLLGEQQTPAGEQFDIQLKGSGRTPYSRQGDGKAAIGPMLREYLLSEAMHGLGIATTRSLAVVKTGDVVYREKPLPGAILTRVAASHIRVGTFQWAAYKGEHELLQQLADYTINRHFSYILEDGKTGEEKYMQFLQQTIKRQAELIAQWQAFGFIHGVMNTDNMAISGETIDYGPCAFLDVYKPDAVFSSIDSQGRYAYQNQPQIGGWNLARFAETLLPLLHKEEDAAVELAQAALYQYSDLFHEAWMRLMKGKLGLFGEYKEDVSLVQEWLDLLASEKADYTLAFVHLQQAEMQCDGSGSEGGIVDHSSSQRIEWIKKWEKRLQKQEGTTAQALDLMAKHNPLLIARNYWVEEALYRASADGDYSIFKNLAEALRNPFEVKAEHVMFKNVPQAMPETYRTFCGT